MSQPTKAVAKLKREDAAPWPATKAVAKPKREDPAPLPTWKVESERLKGALGVDTCAKGLEVVKGLLDALGAKTGEEAVKAAKDAKAREARLRKHVSRLRRYIVEETKTALLLERTKQRPKRARVDDDDDSDDSAVSTGTETESDVDAL